MISRKGVKIFLVQIWVLFIGELKWEYNYIIYKIKGVQIFKHLPSQSCVDSCRKHIRILTSSVSTIRKPACDLWTHLQVALVMFKLQCYSSQHIYNTWNRIPPKLLGRHSEEQVSINLARFAFIPFPDLHYYGYKIISFSFLHEKCVRKVTLREVLDFEKISYAKAWRSEVSHNITSFSKTHHHFTRAAQHCPNPLLLHGFVASL